jgi:tetratricopeptide (TPR) repeat protein
MPRSLRSARIWLLLIAFCGVAILANAVLAAEVELSDPCPPTPLEAAMLSDAGNGRFAHHTLIEAALVAGGIDRPDRSQAYRRKYEACRDAARAACREQQSPRDRAQIILEYMHREILTGGYDPSASQISRMLDDGKFNCVSATVLFNALAIDCGLTMRAVEMRTHAYSIVEIADQSLVVETTCPTWFKAPQPPRPNGIADSIIGGREVSPAALIAVIYYNRGTDALGRNDFAAAVSANLRALRLDPTNAPARGNLLAALNNWALAQCTDGNYPNAVELLDQGRRLDAEHQPFLLNRRHVYRLWIESLVAAGQIEEAAAVLTAARNRDRDCPLWETYAGQLASLHARL